VLETVDQLDSSPRQRPPGERPGEVAAALRMLAFAASDRIAEEAYHRVLFAVGNDHAGSYFPIVLDVVPYLGEILAGGTRCARAGTLEILIDLVGSFGPDPQVTLDPEGGLDDLPARLRDRVATLRPLVEHLGADASSPGVQALARDLLKLLAG
jgi:hypothetical protein